MLQLFDITGKRALVTGATHGLGMAMAKGLGHAGAELIVNGHSPEKMKLALDEYRKEGLTAHPFLFNVTREEEVKAAIG